jgi:hypothetical protein
MQKYKKIHAYRSDRGSSGGEKLSLNSKPSEGHFADSFDVRAAACNPHHHQTKCNKIFSFIVNISIKIVIFTIF